eukprot:3347583-Amphidinium_carterae.1
MWTKNDTLHGPKPDAPCYRFPALKSVRMQKTKATSRHMQDWFGDHSAKKTSSKLCSIACTASKIHKRALCHRFIQKCHILKSDS